ncbi:MAG: hypothetical protein ACRD2T_11695 [Thermoanaerobaculia bacterium]
MASLAQSFTILRGVVYSAAFWWLWAWLAILVRPYDEKLPVALPPWLRPAVFVVAAAGVLLSFAFLLVMHLFVVLHEEPTLAGKFGASYEGYRARVHRWLIRKPG